MPFRKENRVATFLVLAAMLLLGLGGFLAYFALKNPNSGSTPAQLFTGGVLFLAVKYLLGMAQQAYFGAKTLRAIEEGQEAAQERSRGMGEKLDTIERAAKAGTAQAVAEEVQRTIGKQLLEDEDFIEGLAEKLAPRMKMAIMPDLEDMMGKAVARGVQLYREQERRAGS